MNAQDMTWSEYVSMLRRRWRPTLLVFSVIALGSVYVTYALPAVYESSATILIEQQGIPTDFVQTTVNTYAEELLQSIYQRVVAAPKVMELINTHELYASERSVLSDDDLINVFRDSIEMAPQNVTTVHARTGRESIITFGFLISFVYGDPVKAKDVADELANLFVSYNAEMRAETASRTTAFLEREAALLERKIADVSRRVADFKERHANNLPEDQMVNLGTWERLRDELTEIDNRRRDAQERKAILRTDLAQTPKFRPVLDATGEPVLGGADRLAEAQQELVRLRGRYSDDHPEIIALKQEISAFTSSPANLASMTEQVRTSLETRRKQLDTALDSYSEDHPDVVSLRDTVKALEDELNNLQAQVQSANSNAQPNNPLYLQLQARIETADAEISDLNRRRLEIRSRVVDLEARRLASPQVEREYSELIQERDVLQAQYRDIRGLGGEAALGEALETGDSGERLTIIEPPRVPSDPVSPNRVSLSFLGFVLAIAISLGLTSLLEAADTKVRGQRDIHQILEAPPIAIIPYVENSSEKTKRLALNALIAAGLILGFVLVVRTAVS